MDVKKININQSELTYDIASALDAGYLYAGIATPSTNPGTPDTPVFYFAAEPGVYSNFSNITVNANEAAILVWNKGSWTKETTGFATKQQITSLDNKIKTNFLFDYKVTYNSNFGKMMLEVPKDIRKQFIIVAYTDNNGKLVRMIRTTPFNQDTDGDTGWYISTAWETLVSRKEFSEVQGNILLMNKTNFVCRLSNNSSAGDFDKTTNTLYFSSSTNPIINKGLSVLFGIGNKDAIDRMRILSQIGVKPSIQMTVEISNMNVLKGIYFLAQKTS